MSVLEGIILGIVQGLTEFLPISSSGHLVLAGHAFSLETPGVLVEVVLHVGTLLAVLIVYWQVLWRLTRGVMTGDRDAWRYVGLLFIATIPAAFAGVFLKDLFEQAFDNLVLVGINFLVTGAILWSTRGKSGGADRLPSGGKSGAIGIAQAFAILPGISRSGTTVSVAMWLGIDAVKAAEFSFLMAIPTIAGAAVLQIGDLPADLSGFPVVALLAGFLAALVSGVAAIKLLIVLLKQRAFHRFAPYCWGLGGVTIAWALLG